jgi:uncharacterized membrane protein YhfC
MIFGTNLNNKIMYWYYYLNYKIYRFYRRKKDSTPAAMAILAVTTLFFLNIFLVGSIVDLVYPFVKKIEMIKTTAIGLGIICFIINYLLLYRNKYYEEIFDYFDKYESKYKKWDLSVLLYIVLSILFALGNLVFEDGKNNGYW